MAGHVRNFSDVDPAVLLEAFDISHQELRENASQLQERRQRDLMQKIQDASVKALNSPQRSSSCSLPNRSPAIYPSAKT